jgi:hypothetical protein
VALAGFGYAQTSSARADNNFGNFVNHHGSISMLDAIVLSDDGAGGVSMLTFLLE